MHQSSMRHMHHLVSKYGISSGVVTDVGSMDVNGSYRSIFPSCHYIGVDREPGPGVDVVAQDPYRYPLPSRSSDLVVSGQAFEHMEFFWLAWLEMCRIVKFGGLIFLLAPSRGPEHRFPVDCWRFYPDGFRALAKWSGVELVEVTTDWEPVPEPDSAAWGDTVGVFRRYRETIPGQIRRRLLSRSIKVLVQTHQRTPVSRD